MPKDRNKKMNQEFEKNLEDTTHHYQEVMKRFAEEQEAYWNSLSKEDQLKAFCAVCRRIVQGELRDKGSYRWVLYDVFGFGPESYTQGMDCGFMALHNAIIPDKE